MSLPLLITKRVTMSSINLLNLLTLIFLGMPLGYAFCKWTLNMFIVKI